MPHKVIIRAKEKGNGTFILESTKYNIHTQVDNIDEPNNNILESLSKQLGKNKKDIKVLIIKSLSCDAFEDFLEKLVNEENNGVVFYPDEDEDKMLIIEVFKGDKEFSCSTFIDDKKEGGLAVDLNVVESSEKDYKIIHKHFDATIYDVIEALRTI